MVTMSQELMKAARRYLSAYDQVKATEQYLKESKARRDDTERALLDQFTEAGIESITVTDEGGEKGRVLSPLRSLLPSIPADKKEDVIAVFKEHGLDDLIIEQVQSGRLKSWVNEQDEDDETGMPQLPEEIEPFIKIHEKWSISTRNAPKKKTPRRVPKKPTPPPQEEVIELEP